VKKDPAVRKDTHVENRRRGPSLSAIASLLTLAVSLWLEVTLNTALVRSVLVYLGLSGVSLVYRAILSHYWAASTERAQKEMYDRLQREAEEEMRKQAETDKLKAKNEKAKSKPVPAANS
jgi:hypothetical protein